MSDHGYGPRASADPVMDITDFYAFPSPERPGNLVLVMNAFPCAMPTAFFADAIDYRFRLRPVEIGSSEGRPAIAVSASEGVISVTFGVPRLGDASSQPVQNGVCTTADRETIAFRVGDEPGTEQNGLRVFAGCRLDSFFIDQGISGGIRNSRRLPSDVPRPNPPLRHPV